jgi:hypothetical protein
MILSYLFGPVMVWGTWMLFTPQVRLVSDQDDGDTLTEVVNLFRPLSLNVREWIRPVPKKIYQWGTENYLLGTNLKWQALKVKLGWNNCEVCHFEDCTSHLIGGTLKLLMDKFFWYSVFQGFSKAKSANVVLILSSSRFPQLPQKIKLASKVVKVDSKIIISLLKI